MSPMILALIAAAIFAGAFAQRTTGMGFALVSAPFLVLLMGAYSGVLVINFLAIFSGLMILVRVRQHIQWRTYLWLVIPAVIGVLPGSWLANVVPSDWLQIMIGLILIFALAVSVSVKRLNGSVSGNSAKFIAGFSSGVMNAAAGVGGPAMSIYGVLSDWPQKYFAATLQPFFVTVATASVVTKTLTNPDGWPQLEFWAWLVIFVSIVAGLVLGDVSSKWISSSTARAGVILIAFAGAAATVVKGGLALLS